jgi:hypothetical protein
MSISSTPRQHHRQHGYRRHRAEQTDRVVVYDRPTLGAYSTYHSGPGACEHFEEIPAKEQALAPGLPEDGAMRGRPGAPPQ